MPTVNTTATVSEIVKQSEKLRQMIYLKDIIVVMDQALYAKAAGIIWKHADQHVYFT